MHFNNQYSKFVNNLLLHEQHQEIEQQQSMRSEEESQ